MEGARERLVRIVGNHLDDILDRLMQAYAAEIPRIASANDDERALVRGAARKTALAFLDSYARGERPVGPALDEARRVTVERAGEVFERDEIVAMLRIANHVMFQSARALVDSESGVDASEMEQTLETFLSELERSERLSPGGDEALGDLLSAAEAEEPDLA